MNMIIGKTRNYTTDYYPLKESHEIDEETLLKFV